jgi:Flp pilus assembly protein TadG
MTLKLREKMTAWAVRKEPLARDRRAGVTVLFAAAVIPMIALVGLAVDFGIWEQVNANLQLAADAAALNAVKLAGNAELQNDANYITEGQTAGQKWFTAMVGTYDGTITPTVVVSGTTTVTATVTYTGTVNPLFGKMLYGLSGSKGSYPLNGEAQAVVTTAPYLEIDMLLDNSGSMSIAGTLAGEGVLSAALPCDPSDEWVTTSGAAGSWYINAPDINEYQQSFYPANVYACTGTEVPSWPSPPNCPVSITTTGGASATLTAPTGAGLGPLPAPYSSGVACPTKVNGYTAYAGAPCMFACHFDATKQAGLGVDFWSAARHNNVELRLDYLKNATNTTLQQMQTYNLPINNLSVGIYTFNSPNNTNQEYVNGSLSTLTSLKTSGGSAAGLYQIYPVPGAGCTHPNANGNCEADSGFSIAQTYVGTPATGSPYTDTGIQPPVQSFTGGLVTSNNDSDFLESMGALSNYVTASGSGTTATTPKKVLFLITDGMEDDWVTQVREAMPSSYCDQFKNLGYTVYVVYTPYNPNMHSYFLNYLGNIAIGNGAGTITNNLKACSSDPANDYISAETQNELKNALAGFLQAALNSPTRFSM